MRRNYMVKNNQQISNENIDKTKKNKKYNLKNDIIFKTFFSRKGNEIFLIDFLEALLKIKIEEIQVKEEVNLETGKTANKVTIPYSTLHTVSYTYNAETKKYERYTSKIK